MDLVVVLMLVWLVPGAVLFALAFWLSIYVFANLNDWSRQKL
jgi:hypothetical protein